MGAPTNLDAWSGADKRINISVTDESNLAVNLGAYADIEWFLKDDEDSTEKLVNYLMSGGNGNITITSPLGGTFSVVLSGTDTVNLGGSYFWQSDLIDSLGNRTPVAYGYVFVHGEQPQRTAYCSLEETLAIMAGVPITDKTTPSVATAQLIVETIAREIDGVLMGRGYMLPITEPNAYSFLKTINQYGAAAAIILSRQPGDIGMSSDRGAFGKFQTKYQAWLQQLRDPHFNLYGADTIVPVSVMSAGYTTKTVPVDIDSDVDYTTPWWWRGKEW